MSSTKPTVAREHARIRPQQLAELMQQPVVRGLRVADGDEDPVRAQQVQRPGPQAPVPAHEAVLADDALERSHARDEHDHDHHRVRGREAREAAERGRDAAGGLQRSRALGGHAEREGDPESQPGQRGEKIDDDRARARGQRPPRGRDAQSRFDERGLRLGLRLAVAAPQGLCAHRPGNPGVLSTTPSARIVIAS